MRICIAISLFCVFIILPIAPVSACTTFCMDTPDGPVFGFNLDWFLPGDGLVFVNQRGMAKTGFPSQAGTTGTTISWVSKYGSVSFNLAGREFAVGGMNEAGLVVGAMQLVASEFPEKDERPALTIGFWAQYVLDTCASIDDVLKVDPKVRIEDSSPPVHYLISDAKGNCVAIEWLDGKCVTYSGQALPIRAMSNMPYGRALAAYNRGGARWWWSNPGRSAERFAHAYNRSKDYDAAQDPDTIAYAFKTLLEVAAPETKWSIVYDMGKREIWYGTVVSQSLKHISFDKLDFACDKPLLMYDINAAVEGDVEKLFTPYDFEVNLKLFNTLCQRDGLDVSPDQARGAVEHFESFKCTTEKN